MMMHLNDIRNSNILDSINWNMTPEDAVTLYLEWGNNWNRGHYVIRSKNDVAYYFVVNTWENPPVVYLMRRNSEDAQELAKIELPDKVRDEFLESIGHHKGVYSIEGNVKNWLQKELSIS